jgi:hypothetical protein
VIGNCGLGLHPANAAVDEMYLRIAPIVFGESGTMCSRTLGDYRARLESTGISVNAAPLIAHGNVRAMVMAMSEQVTDASGDVEPRTARREALWDARGSLMRGAYAKTERSGWPSVVARVITRRTCERSPVEAVAEAMRSGRRPVFRVDLASQGGEPLTGAGQDDAGDDRRCQFAGVLIHSDVYPYAGPRC